MALFDDLGVARRNPRYRRGKSRNWFGKSRNCNDERNEILRRQKTIAEIADREMHCAGSDAVSIGLEVDRELGSWSQTANDPFIGEVAEVITAFSCGPIERFIDEEITANHGFKAMVVPKEIVIRPRGEVLPRPKPTKPRRRNSLMRRVKAHIRVIDDSIHQARCSRF